jgi:tight adherence protein C
VTALLAGLSVFLIVAAGRRPATSTVIGRYVGGPLVSSARGGRDVPEDALLGTGIGAVTGSLLLPVPWSLGLVAGAFCGFAIAVGSQRRRRRRRARRLGYELPAIADLLGLYVRSGESVHGAMRRVCVEATGIAASEMSSAIESIESGTALVEAMRTAAGKSVHPDGARLYELLAQAHRSGARLVDALEIFSADRRSAIARDMTEEGGRRALIGYGPILGLMIPTTLAFLIYPTLAGLDALAAAP